MKKIVITTIFQVFLYVQGATAQTYTYNHDATKMNQFLMQETGTGSFQSQSEWYYDAMHRNYKSSLLGSNKQTYRSAAFQGSYGQVSNADSIRKRLEDRAKEEAINIADREVDLAWISEKGKIENALAKYMSNLTTIASLRIDTEESEDWQMYPKMWEFAIERTGKAYMANSERQKEYLAIYDEIVQKNTKLVKRIRYLNSLNVSLDVLDAHIPSQMFKKDVQASYRRWRENAANTVTNDNKK